MTSLPSHFRLPALKTFATRLLFYASEPPITPGNFKAAGRVVKVLELHSENLGDSGVSVSTEFLSDAVKRTGNLIAITVGSVGGYLDPFKQAINGLDCMTCSAGNVCTGNWRDSDTVHQRGQCIQPLKNLFRLVEQFSRDWYTENSTDHACPPYELVLQTGPPDGEKPHDIAANYHVAGKARPEAEQTIIKLLLHPHQFDRDTNLACLYVLFHEIICHGFQGLVASKNDLRRDAFAEDEFGEGWMDFLALQLLERFLDEGDPAAQNLVHIRETERAAEIARDFHHRRHDLSRPPKCADVYWSGVRTGKDVLRFLHDLIFLKVGPTSPEAEKQFFRLSADFNKLQTTVAERQTWMQRLRNEMDLLYRIPRTERATEYAIRGCHLVTPFGKYMRGEADIAKLLADVCN